MTQGTALKMPLSTLWPSVCLDVFTLDIRLDYASSSQQALDKWIYRLIREILFCAYGACARTLIPQYVVNYTGLTEEAAVACSKGVVNIGVDTIDRPHRRSRVYEP
jgi:hypothetical protein